MTLFRQFLFFVLFSCCTPVFAESVKDNIRSENKEIPNPTTIYQFQEPRIDTIVIRFDYKQSALFQSYTLDALDSIIDLLLKNKKIMISIDGYAYRDEGTDTICYYLSLNRALFIQTYMLGRGVDSSRISSIRAYGKTRQKYINKDKDGLMVNCRAELRIVYPIPPEMVVEPDRDKDGVVDKIDKCPDVFGYKDNDGCPANNRVIVPFPVEEATLYSKTYKVLDSVIDLLNQDPSLYINIDGHAFIAEGASSVTNKLAMERAEIVKQYLFSRFISSSRILSVKSYGTSRPVNTGDNPLAIIKNARVEITLINK